MSEEYTKDYVHCIHLTSDEQYTVTMAYKCPGYISFYVWVGILTQYGFKVGVTLPKITYISDNCYKLVGIKKR